MAYRPQPNRFSGHDAHRSSPENGYHFAAPHVGPVDVGEEKYSLIAAVVRRFPVAGVGIRHAHELGLAAVQVGIAKKGSFFGHQAALGAVVVGVGLFAVARQVVVAEQAVIAGHRKESGIKQKTLLS